MPKLWNETIETHRHAVREAALDATAALVAERGLLSVTMSRIAQEAGIGRATLYKYFPDVESILAAWHERRVTGHLEHLTAVRDQAGSPGERLEAVLTAYALMIHQRGEHHGTEIAALLHQGEPIAEAHRQLHDLVQDLLAEGAQAGELRDDVSPDELADYCLHALSAAAGLPSEAAVRRLVAVTLTGVHLTANPVNPGHAQEDAAEGQHPPRRHRHAHH
ncbi:TetR/AcrR family transcriptional regulator [Streptomyces sp. P9(2023)]|uniref:TetR/AcrR family transcriptional regulator n=1 Tax=Streptomyces sp. P9(2023) TaxID=3064394 RepID=UPI0028F42245|nr:TetR/AcrR family transcriptional regulator [Streptomyces sp. P9(2023)]MDT9692998.1 TetR/AcrR family transcriptional regulator [Streptomyces sp. P9(2023)]